MSILYSLVAYRNDILCHFTKSSGNFIEITSKVLKKIPRENQNQKSYYYNRYVFHYLIERNIVFLCLTEDTMDRKFAFAFLFECKENFFSQFSFERDIANATNLSLNNRFSHVLSQLMEQYSNSPGMDRINSLKEKMEVFTNQMNENIEKLLGRDEKIDLLINESDSVRQTSNQFLTKAKEMRWKIWKEKMIYMAVLLFLALVILWLISSLF